MLPGPKITESQIGFIADLAHRKAVPAELQPLVVAILEERVEVGRQVASSLIDALNAAAPRGAGWRRLTPDEMLAELAKQRRTAAGQRSTPTAKA